MLTNQKENTVIRRIITWASEWVETLRVAPPFSRRRRDLIALSRKPLDPADYVELDRP